jgi:hypothetical protein
LPHYRGAKIFRHIRREFVGRIELHLAAYGFLAGIGRHSWGVVWRDSSNRLNTGAVGAYSHPRYGSDAPWVLRVSLNCAPLATTAATMRRLAILSDDRPAWRTEISVLPHEADAALAEWVADFIAAKDDGATIIGPAPHGLICPIGCRYSWSQAARNLYQRWNRRDLRRRSWRKAGGR